MLINTDTWGKNTTNRYDATSYGLATNHDSDKRQESHGGGGSKEEKSRVSLVSVTY